MWPITYFNTMKLWTYNPNLHCPSWTPSFVCFFAYFSPFLFACLHASLFLCSPCLPCLYALCLFHMLFVFLPFPCLFAGLLSLPLQVHTWSEDTLSKGIVSQAQAKRARRQACRANWLCSIGLGV